MFQFTEDMKMGIPLIDSQHKSMIDFANKLSALCGGNAGKEEMKESLDFLGNYVVQHFNDEEKMQMESNYPRYQQHRDIHQEFVQTFQSLSAEFEKSGSSAEFTDVLTNSVFNWIITHIKKEDVVFGKHYTEMKLKCLKLYIPE